ncbi:MAG: hypothetical protein OJF47_000238 [Nitrospira sp.]|jgi:hypothetical protein|nr:MAG: hypothetical protein OJF47_000238 [Nitrospira sp.]
MATNQHQAACLDYCSPIRNRYFYGKLLDVFHFELEQDYFNSKRWLLNRLVSGYGVVCGLNVVLGADKKHVSITPGVALDRCGHEIIVCQPPCPIPLPLPPSPPPAAGGSPASGGTAGEVVGTGSSAEPSPTSGGNGGGTGSTNSGTGAENCDCGQYVHVVLCYHECLTDPSPSMAGDCDTAAMCSPGAIRERYSVQLIDGKLPPARTTSAVADLFTSGSVNYQALANYVTGLSPTDPCPDCCIPLANILVPEAGQTYDQTNIDVTIRPVVYGLDLLYEMLLAMKQGPTSASARKP